MIISDETLNFALPVVTVAVMTTRKTHRVFRTEVLVQPPEGGLSRPSKVLLYQIPTVAKARLTEYLGQLSEDSVVAIDAALRLALGLDG